MSNKVFNPKKLDKLNNPVRLEEIPPKLIWDKLELNDPKVLVDIGAGTGFFSKAFLPFITNGKIYACDISDVMLDWVKENVCHEFPEILPVKIENGIIPLDKRIADLVFMINLHHEIDNHRKLLKQANALLKKSRKILIVDWKKAEMEQGPSIDIRFTIDEVKEQLTESGFANLQSFELTKHFVVIGEKE